MGFHSEGTRIRLHMEENYVDIKVEKFFTTDSPFDPQYILINFIEYIFTPSTTIKREDPTFFYHLEKCIPYLITYYPCQLKEMATILGDTECREFILTKIYEMQNTGYKFKYITYIDSRTGENRVGVVEEFTQRSINKIGLFLPYIDDLYSKAKSFLESDINDRYNTFFKEKRSGGKRRIDIPDDELKAFMRNVNYFINYICHINFPSNVYGFVKNKSTKMLAENHTSFSYDFKGMIEVDIKDFFPNCTLDKLMYSMKTIYPFCLMDATKLEVILKACMVKYDGKYRLPQGAPTSPVLSNIIMLPIDFLLIHGLTHEPHSNFVNSYTRYADNIYVSLKGYLYLTTTCSIKQKMQDALNGFDFYCNLSKSKIHKFKQTNRIFVTGIMINKRRNITIGHINKQYLKSYIFDILMEAKNNKTRDKKSLQSILGKIGYFRYIEPDFVDKVIEKYEQKTGMNYKESVKKLLCS